MGWHRVPVVGVGGSRSHRLAQALLVSAAQGPRGLLQAPLTAQGPWVGGDPLDTSAVAVGVACWS